MHVALLKRVARVSAHLRFRRQTPHPRTADDPQARESFGSKDEVAVLGGHPTTLLIEAHNVEVEFAPRIIVEHERRCGLHGRVLTPDQGE